MENLENTMEISAIKDKNELIKNLELKNLIQFKLDKTEFQIKDLDSIDEIILDSQNIVGAYNKLYFEDVTLFRNLKKISIRNLGLTLNDIKNVSNIKNIEFVNCEIRDITMFSNVEHLSLINTEIDNFEEIKKLSNLIELQLINIKIDNFEFLKTFTNLKKLVIKNIKDFSLSKIDFSLPIEYLSVEKIDKLELEIISKYKNLKTLSVDREESYNFEKELKELKNIKILLNDMYEY